MKSNIQGYFAPSLPPFHPPSLFLWTERNEKQVPLVHTYRNYWSNSYFGTLQLPDTSWLRSYGTGVKSSTANSRPNINDCSILASGVGLLRANCFRDVPPWNRLVRGLQLPVGVEWKLMMIKQQPIPLEEPSKKRYITNIIKMQTLTCTLSNRGTNYRS